MPRMLSKWGLGALLTCSLVLLSTVLLQAQTSERSDVIYPDQQLPLQFSHVQHLSKVDMECGDCHTTVANSQSSLDNNLPKEADCAGCHPIQRSGTGDRNRAAKSCTTCHFSDAEGLIARVVLPIPNIKFSHRAHILRGTTCTACHGDFVGDKVGLATRQQLPKMATCLACHDGKRAAKTCTTCHLSEAGGVMRTEFPGLGKLIPSATMKGAAHTGDFLHIHKYVAQNDQGLCASCHKKDFCADCHNGVTKPLQFHIGDYVKMHGTDARRNSPDCSSCHRLQTFCQGCHSRMGIAADGKAPLLAGIGRFHPVGWSAPGLLGRGLNHHSFAAQRNIKECASCHRESFCTQCHGAQPNSPRINPHPRNWRNSRRCEALAKRNIRMCLRCHVEGNIDCR